MTVHRWGAQCGSLKWTCMEALAAGRGLWALPNRNFSLFDSVDLLMHMCGWALSSFLYSQLAFAGRFLWMRALCLQLLIFYRFSTQCSSCMIRNSHPEMGWRCVREKELEVAVQKTGFLFPVIFTLWSENRREIAEAFLNRPCSEFPIRPRMLSSLHLHVCSPRVCSISAGHGKPNAQVCVSVLSALLWAGAYHPSVYTYRLFLVLIFHPYLSLTGKLELLISIV